MLPCKHAFLIERCRYISCSTRNQGETLIITDKGERYVWDAGKRIIKPATLSRLNKKIWPYNVSFYERNSKKGI